MTLFGHSSAQARSSTRCCFPPSLDSPQEIYFSVWHLHDKDHALLCIVEEHRLVQPQAALENPAHGVSEERRELLLALLDVLELQVQVR